MAHFSFDVCVMADVSLELLSWWGTIPVCLSQGTPQRLEMHTHGLAGRVGIAIGDGVDDFAMVLRVCEEELNRWNGIANLVADRPKRIQQVEQH